MLSETARQAILDLQKQYPEPRSALIPALHIAQAELNYLPREAQEEIAELFNLAVNEVNAVITFYDMFHEKPVGKHVIHVCKNVSCMLRGCDELLTSLCHKLQCSVGEMTADGEFTVIASECLGACDRAPMALVDDRVVGPINVNQVDAFIADARKGHGHPSPMTAAEVTRE